MKDIKLIRNRIVGSGESGIFHDSRKDIKTIGKMLNEVIDKVNEIVICINKLNSDQNVQVSDTTEAQ